MKETKIRDFKGIWIPRDIYLNDNLSWTEKILLIEIHSLDKGKGCFASARYLADFLMVRPQVCNRAISKLAELGLITINKDGKSRIFSSEMGTKKFRDGNLKVPSENEIVPSENEIVPNFSEKEPRNGLTEPEKEDDSPPNNTINNTINNILTSEEVSTQQEQKQPHWLGSSSLQRVVNFHQLLSWYFYEDLQPIHWGRLGKTFKPLLEQYTSAQLIALLIVYFSWAGSEGEDEYVRKRLSVAHHPLLWFPRDIQIYTKYLSEVEKTSLADQNAVTAFIKHTINSRSPHSFARVYIPEGNGEIKMESVMDAVERYGIKKIIGKNVSITG